jgi:D-beta-D-heptose 7-phosphate kinase/D-beta-D-heptose 1-phosphate adenosyltransferase
MRIGIISGYFNPLHTGHLDYIESAKRQCGFLYVIVNNDSQVRLKGSKLFMDAESRRRIVAALEDVNGAMIAMDNTETVVESLKYLHWKYVTDPFVDSIAFMNGGDRAAGNTPEEIYCKEVGIKTIYGVGGKKTQSSSELIRGNTN